MKERGYIALARCALDHPVVGATKPYSSFEAWIWLIKEAAWKPRRIRITNGRTISALPIERGQLSYSLSYMANAWGWSVKRVRTFLNRLETDGQIETQTGTQQTVITISNYDLYQRGGGDAGTQTEMQTGRQWAVSRQQTEEGKKETKDRTRSPGSELPGFAEWYLAYPRKKKRKDAARAFANLIQAGEIALPDLMAKTQAFNTAESARPENERQFIPYPATWLNSGGYLDEPDAAASQGGSSRAYLKIEPPTRDARSFTDDEWRERLAIFNGRGEWSETHWGPRPGAAGCWVPSHLLITPVEREPKRKRATG